MGSSRLSPTGTNPVLQQTASVHSKEPPLLAAKLDADANRRKAWLTIRMLFILTLLSALCLAALTRIPMEAEILVPWEYGDTMERALNDAGVAVTRDRAGNFNCQYFRSVQGLAYQVWRSERFLLKDATTNGYYCEITYTPVLEGCDWRKCVGNSRMVGLQ